MQVARLDDGRGVALTKEGTALLVALITIVPPSVSALVDYVLKPKLQASTVSLETGRLDIEKRKLKAELYRAALANSDPAQRQLLVQFLIRAKVLEDDGTIDGLSASQIPQWPATPGSAP